MLGNNFLLWEDEAFIVCTPFNPHFPYSEGPIVIIKTKRSVKHAWQDDVLTGQAFQLVARVCQVMEKLQLSPWFNIQANGNWGLLPDATPFFHIYIYGRNKTERWGKPVIIPETPKTYKNEPMPETDRQKLIDSLQQAL